MTDHKAVMQTDLHECPTTVAGALMPDGARRNIIVKTRKLMHGSRERAAITDNLGGYRAFANIYVNARKRLRRVTGRVKQTDDKDWVFVPDKKDEDLFTETNARA